MRPVFAFGLVSTLLWTASFAGTASAQGPLPRSGSLGIELFALVDASQQASVWAASKAGAAFRVADLTAPPSRWLHRRRHMAAEETPLLNDGPVVFVPVGDSASNGGLTVIDLRGRVVATNITLSAPAAYDPLIDRVRKYAICACDAGGGQTRLQVVSYGNAGSPSRIATLTLNGAPAGGVTWMLTTGRELLVPTTAGVHILAIGGASAPLTPGAFVSTGTRSPVTNVAMFVRGTAPHFAVLASNFNTNNVPTDAAIVSFNLAGTAITTDVGSVPGTSPAKPYLPAAGFHEPGVVQSGGIAFVAFLLRESPPGTFFTKPAGVAVAGFGMPNDPTLAIPRTSPASGEPFAEIAVSGTRMAFMTSGSPPFWPAPPGGSERLNVLYTPFDPLGVGTTGGVIGSAGPLGGRIGVEVTDRPLWSRDGKSLFVTTVNYPGAPNPGLSGSEILRVPDARVINEVEDPMVTVVPLRNQTTERAHGLPTVFDPELIPASAFGSFTLFGQMTETAAHGVLLPQLTLGYLANETSTPRALPRSLAIPPFPAIPPRSFEDVTGSIVPPPATYGARRASFNLLEAIPTVLAAYLVQSDGNELLYTATGLNIAGFGSQIQMVRVALPSGSMTASELLSL